MEMSVNTTVFCANFDMYFHLLQDSKGLQLFSKFQNLISPNVNKSNWQLYIWSIHLSLHIVKKIQKQMEMFCFSV